jgi:hypothetical protein
MIYLENYKRFFILSCKIFYSKIDLYGKVILGQNDM